MKITAEKLLSVAMGFIAVFHLVTGTGLMFFPGFQKFAVGLYGAHLEWSLKDIYFIRIIGSFAFVLGVLAYSAAKNPLKHQIVIIAFIEFFILRNIHRHLYANEVYEAFSITPQVNVLTSVFFFLQVIALSLLLWWARQKCEKGGSPF